MNLPDRILDGLAIGLRAGNSGTLGDRPAEDGGTPFADVLMEVSSTSGAPLPPGETMPAGLARGLSRLSSVASSDSGSTDLAGIPGTAVSNGSLTTDASSKVGNQTSKAEGLLDLLAVPTGQNNVKSSKATGVPELSQQTTTKQVNMSSIDGLGPDTPRGRSTKSATSSFDRSKLSAKGSLGLDVKQVEAGSVSAMIDRLAKGVGTAKPDGDAAKSEAGKDSTAPDRNDDSQDKPTQVPSDGSAPPALLAMLMLGAGTTRADPASAATSARSVSAKLTPALSASNEPAQAIAIPASAEIDASLRPESTTAVTQLSVATHLAPKPVSASDTTEVVAPSTDIPAGVQSNPATANPNLSKDDGESAHRDHETASAPAELHDASVMTEPHQTNLPPVVSKIAAAITDLAARATVPTLTQAPQPGPAQTMNLRIEQAGSGPIDIKMHMSGRTLDLQLTVSDRQTLSDLSREREALVSALDDRNYHLHTLVIQDGSGVPASGGSHVGSGDTGSGARQDTQSLEQGNGQGAGTQSDRDQSKQEGRRASQQAQRDSAGNRSGQSLFV